MVNQSARLDIHEQQIQQLQDDVTAIKDSLKALNDDRSESAEFRKVVLAWMKSQEKKSPEIPPDSGDSGLSGSVFTYSGPKSGPVPSPELKSHPDSSSSLPWAVKKVKLPEFSGFDPQGWIQKANLYFDLNKTPDASRIQLAQLSMIGVAQHWFTIITQVRSSLSWLAFQSELLQRFSGLEIQNPFEQLATIQQSDSIYDYIDDFEYLLSLVPRLPESQALGYFVAGLKADVKQWVRLHRPQSRLDAMYLAKDVELMLRPTSGAPSLSRFRYLNQFGSQPFGLTADFNTLGHYEPKTSLNNNTSDTESSIVPLISTPKSVLPSSSNTGQVFHHDRGVRSLSRTEWEERRKKGLCYKCGQQYSPAHKCPEGKLRVMLLGDDEPDGLDGLHFQLEHMDTLQLDGGLPTVAGSFTMP